VLSACRKNKWPQHHQCVTARKAGDRAFKEAKRIPWLRSGSPQARFSVGPRMNRYDCASARLHSAKAVQQPARQPPKHRGSTTDHIRSRQRKREPRRHDSGHAATQDPVKSCEVRPPHQHHDVDDEEAMKMTLTSSPSGESCTPVDAVDESRPALPLSLRRRECPGPKWHKRANRDSIVGTLRRHQPSGSPFRNCPCSSSRRACRKRSARPL
jgi:hypothetical protein